MDGGIGSLGISAAGGALGPPVGREDPDIGPTVQALARSATPIATTNVDAREEPTHWDTGCHVTYTDHQRKPRIDRLRLATMVRNQLLT